MCSAVCSAVWRRRPHRLTCHGQGVMVRDRPRRYTLHRIVGLEPSGGGIRLRRDRPRIGHDELVMHDPVRQRNTAHVVQASAEDSVAALHIRTGTALRCACGTFGLRVCEERWAAATPPTARCCRSAGKAIQNSAGLSTGLSEAEYLRYPQYNCFREEQQRGNVFTVFGECRAKHQIEHFRTHISDSTPHTP